jgi:hypothetical protein
MHTMALVHRQPLRALERAGRGITFCEAKGIDVSTVRMHVRRAQRATKTLDQFDFERDCPCSTARLSTIRPPGAICRRRRRC